MYVSFTVVLDIIICFSAHFWDNSTLMLKIRFQVFSSTSKHENINVVVISALLSLQNHISVFWNFNS